MLQYISLLTLIFVHYRSYRYRGIQPRSRNRKFINYKSNSFNRRSNFSENIVIDHDKDKCESIIDTVLLHIEYCLCKKSIVIRIVYKTLNITILKLYYSVLVNRCWSIINRSYLTGPGTHKLLYYDPEELCHNSTALM